MNTFRDPARSTCRLLDVAASPRSTLSDPPVVDGPSSHRVRSPWIWFGVAASLVVWGSTISGQAQVYGAIDVWPQNTTVEVGGTKQFGAYVPITPNTLTWLVNEVPGGNAQIGTISPAGLYQAPAVAPANNVLTIKARSTAYPNAFKTTPLTVIRPYPWLWSVSPSTLQVGTFAVSFNGSNFAPDSVAQANGVDLVTTFVSSTSLKATGVAAATGTLQFRVRQPGPGAVTGNVASATVSAPTITVGVSPGAVSANLGSSVAFSATVGGTGNTTVTWSVPGGASQGSISSGGVYTAPTVMPGSPAVKVRATSNANPSVFAEATVTLTVPPPVLVAVSPSQVTVTLAGSQPFTASVTGAADSSVVWSVLGGSANGTVTSAGLYLAPATLPASPTVTLRATSVAVPTSFAEATVTLAAAPSGTPLLAAARIAEQTSFGPNDALLSTIQQLGLSAYLSQQFSLPATSIPTPADNSVSSLQQWQLHTFTTAPDQLRQRMIYALSQIIVVSANKNIYADAMLPWMRALRQHAFGNYRDLLRDVTRSSSMGKYLDLANSTKPGFGGGANENYARELMQLFTIGLWQLGADGSFLTGANNTLISTYTQNDVAELARALTGWVYAQPPGGQAYEWHGAPMITAPQNHDFGAKTVLGVAIPANQTVEADLESVLDILMNHPNTAPFVVTRLIRSLVTSNPSSGYIDRVADVFRDTNGDLQATLTAILTDTEARDDNPSPDSGRLKDPILHVCGFLRALNGHFKNPNQIVYLFENLAQSPLNPPSVFSWFSPLFRVPGLPVYGPEFQIYTPTEATLRGNLFHHILSNPSSGDFAVDLAPYLALGNDMLALVELVNLKLLHGRMPAGMKQVLIDAAAPGYDAGTRVQTVLYLTALSGQYAIQH